MNHINENDMIEEGIYNINTRESVRKAIPGDVVVCIDVDSELSYLEKNLNNIIDGKLLLTFGKKYTIEGLSFENYSLKNDNGYYSDYKHSRFVTNYEFRNDKINKILE